MRALRDRLLYQQLWCKRPEAERLVMNTKASAGTFAIGVSPVGVMRTISGRGQFRPADCDANAASTLATHEL